VLHLISPVCKTVSQQHTPVWLEHALSADFDLSYGQNFLGRKLQKWLFGRYCDARELANKASGWEVKILKIGRPKQLDCHTRHKRSRC
jgi:hypothetical protein